MQYKLADFEIKYTKNPDEKIAELQRYGFVAPDRENLPPVDFSLPFNWNKDPFQDRNWMFQLHAWRMLDPCLSQLLNSPDGREAFLLDYIVEVIYDWVRGNYSESAGIYTWYDMSVGLRALKLALMAVLANKFDYENFHSGLVERVVDLHIEELLDPAKLSSGNHGLFQLHGLMALAYFYPERPKSEAGKNFALKKMVDLINSQLGNAGVHTESSPEYHFFALKKIKRIIATPWWATIESRDIREKIKKAENASSWLVDPLGRCVPVGDSSAKYISRSVDTLLDWPHCEGRRSLGAVLDGYAVVRSKPSLAPADSFMLFFTSSFYSQTHKHSDCLSFIWQEGGENILIDSGKYGYQKDKFREYFMSSRAHNTLELNGRSDSRKSGYAYGSGISSLSIIDQTWVVRGLSIKNIELDSRGENFSFRHERTLVYRPGKFLCVFDKVAPRKARGWKLFRRNSEVNLSSWWHFSPGFKKGTAARGSDFMFENSALSLAVSGQHLCISGQYRKQYFEGSLEPRVQGWESSEYLEKHSAPALGIFSSFKKSYFSATLFELVPSGNTPSLSINYNKNNKRIFLDIGGMAPLLKEMDDSVGFSFSIDQCLL